MRWTLVLSVLAMLLAPQFVLADPPETMNYQGVLRQAGGQLVPDGDYSLTFRLYTLPAGGAAIWTETDTVSVAGGVFDVVLGKKSALSMSFNLPYWLGISVGANPELTPRVELTSAPYAFRAGVANALEGGTGDNDWTISGNNMYSAVSGNVGIGDATPDAKLDVETTTITAGEFTSSGTGMSFTLRANNSTGNTAAFFNNYAGAYPATPTAVYARASGERQAGFFVNDGSTAALIGQSQGTGHAIWGWAYGSGYSGYFTGGAGVRVTGLLHTDSYRMSTGASNGYVLTSDASGNGTWQAASTGMGGSGTTGYIPKFTAATTLGNSVISESAGNVTISSAPVPPQPTRKPGDDGEDMNRITRKLYVTGTDQQVVYGYLSESNTTEDGRAAVYGYRTRSVQSDGSGYGATSTNNAITGYNYWGDVYTFGVAGYSYNDYTRTGGVIGANSTASYWGALGYKDESSSTWGMYTPNRTYIGDDAIINGNLYMSNNYGAGTTYPAIKAENTNASGIAVFAVTHGSDATLVCTQNGTGDIIRGFNGGGSPPFRVTNTGRVVTPVVEITGGSDLAEPFSMVNGDEVPAGALVVIDDLNPGQLRMSDRPYDSRVAGIVSGAGGVRPGLTLDQKDRFEGGQHVALTGRVYALADASSGPIRPGDLLTTSTTPGHAMKATDRERSHGAIIGKAMSSLDEGTGLVLVLVNLQ